MSIGFCYNLICFSRESWEKVNITWLDDGKKVQFGQKKNFTFRKDLSVSDEETTLTLLNLPMMVSTKLIKYLVLNF